MRGFGGWTADTVFQPFIGAAIGAPPLAEATPGRLNRDGVSFLYLATEEARAAAEVRPRWDRLKLKGGAHPCQAANTKSEPARRAGFS
jgi:hypothetical protein